MEIGTLGKFFCMYLFLVCNLNTAKSTAFIDEFLHDANSHTKFEFTSRISFRHDQEAEKVVLYNDADKSLAVCEGSIDELQHDKRLGKLFGRVHT